MLRLVGMKIYSGQQCACAGMTGNPAALWSALMRPAQGVVGHYNAGRRALVIHLELRWDH
jgi:hypothetical protein